MWLMDLLLKIVALLEAYFVDNQERNDLSSLLQTSHNLWYLGIILYLPFSILKKKKVTQSEFDISYVVLKFFPNKKKIVLFNF